MINPIILYSIGGALLAGFLGGWTIRDWKADSEHLKQLERAHKAEKAVLTAVNGPSELLEDFLADLRPAQTQTRNTIREVYRDVKVPTDCTVHPAGVSLLEAAHKRANAATTGELGAELRRPAKTTDAADRPGSASVGG